MRNVITSGVTEGSALATPHYSFIKPQLGITQGVHVYNPDTSLCFLQNHRKVSNEQLKTASLSQQQIQISPGTRGKQRTDEVIYISNESPVKQTTLRNYIFSPRTMREGNSLFLPPD